MNYEHFMNTNQAGLVVRRPVWTDRDTENNPLIDITAHASDGDEYGPVDRITLIRVAQTGRIVYDGYADNWREFAAWVKDSTGRDFRAGPPGGDDLDFIARLIGDQLRFMVRKTMDSFQ